jgi:peptidoglycan/xylan/chitin deacetylase (PgdA/CDA1 family)
VVYLTFDDGPSTVYTPQVLNLLDRYHAKATFFQVGRHVSAHPASSRAVVRRGHVVANHTWDHADLTRLSDAGARREIDRAQRALATATGRHVTCLRAPYGATNNRVTSIAASRGLTITSWDVDPGDWARPGASVIAQRILSAVRPGDVVLMHDGGGDRHQTVSALRTVLRYLAAKGYRFDRLPGCR